ncbi:MAG: hypothetical protein ACKVQS_02735 [Fimbriimonadaceae bacterium]
MEGRLVSEVVFPERTSFFDRAESPWAWLVGGDVFCAYGGTLDVRTEDELYSPLGIPEEFREVSEETFRELVNDSIASIARSNTGS